MRSIAADNPEHEPKPAPEVEIIEGDDILDRVNIIPWMFGLVLFLALLELPYSGISLPKMILIPFGIMSLLAATAISLQHYFVALLILSAYLPFSKLLVGDFSGFMFAFNITNIFTALVLIGWIVRGGMHGKRIFYSSPVDLPLAGFIFLAVVSLVRGGMETEGGISLDTIIELKRYLTPLFFFYIFSSNIRSYRQFKTVVVVIVFSVFICALMGIKEFYIDIGPMGSYEKSRVQGICEQSNNLGAFFTYYSMFFLAYFLLTKSTDIKNRWMYLVAFFCCARVTNFTFSRGAMLAFGSTSMFILFNCSRRIAICIVLAGAFTLYFFPEELPDSIIGRFRQNVQVREGFEFDTSLDKSADDRLTHWWGAMKMIRYNPVIGIGYGLYQQQAHIYAEARLAVRDVHQGLLLIGAEMGAPALLMFLFILLTFFRTGWYLYRRTHDPFTRAFGMSMMGMIIGVLVANCFGDRLNSLELSSYFWILGGVSMAVKRMFESGTGNFPEQEFSEETGTESEIHPAATLRDASRRELASAADIRRGIGK